ncbi:MAG: hypothetical protein JXB00_01505 [Bacteroidales bacterium]|nr:hypothetical protein [Bacteroidales bacterium]
MKNLIYILSVFFLASCAASAKFPVSQVTPAAVITASVQKDKNNNNAITVKAKYLASPDRLTPARNTYVVWINTTDSGLKNVGQLQIKNAQSAVFKTITSFEIAEIIITAEDEGNVEYPAGTEISRSKMN